MQDDDKICPISKLHEIMQTKKQEVKYMFISKMDYGPYEIITFKAESHEIIGK